MKIPNNDSELDLQMARFPLGWKPSKMFNSVGEYVDMMYPFILQVNGNPMKIDSYTHHNAIINHLFMKPLLKQ